jgi:hypothetical protein
MVTVDSPSQHNIIIWEKPDTTIIDFYRIYKETFQPDVYELIGALNYSEPGFFIDKNCNPKAKAEKYKITYVDTNGVESSRSTSHNTIHFVLNQGVSGEINLAWNNYEGFIFDKYYIYRGLSSDNLILMDSIASTFNTYSDINPTGGDLYYRISAVKEDSCYLNNPGDSISSSPYYESLSNVKDYSCACNYLIVDPLIHTFDSISGNSRVFKIYTNRNDWKVETSATWLNLSIDSVNRQFTVTANSSSSGRIATVYVSAPEVDTVQVTVIQGTVGIKESDFRTSLKIYPNPFTFQTNISYELKNNSAVRLCLYNVIGKEVVELVNCYQNAGKYKYQFSSRDNGLRSGIYYIRLEVEGKFVTRKLIQTD